MKKLLGILIVLLLLSLTGCSGLPDDQYEALRNGTLSEEYETVDATITELDLYSWYASTIWYQWKINVHQEDYDLEYTDEQRVGGAFSAPSFIYKRKGDTVSVRVKSTYIEDELVERKIIQIY